MTNRAGAFFDTEGLKTFVATNSALSADDFADALLTHLQQWSGRGRLGTPFEDDLTLAIVDVLA